jgi:hypothetical protein
MSLVDKIKDHIVVVVSTTAITAFGLGWTAYDAQRRVAKDSQEELQTITATRLQEAKAELDRCKQAKQPPDDTGRPSFADGQWHHLSFPTGNGLEVASRLTEIGPPEDGVVISYDGSRNNTFHVWYRGAGTGTRYSYTLGTAADLAGDPLKNFFLQENGVIPAGIGGIGDSAIPIFFVATRPKQN